MNWKAVLTIAVIAVITVAVVVRVPTIRGLIFGNGPSTSS